MIFLCIVNLDLWLLTWRLETRVEFLFRLPITLFREALKLELSTLKEPHHCIMLLAITIWPSAGFCGVCI